VPAGLEISDKAEELEIGKLTKVKFLMLNVAHANIVLSGNSSREIPYLHNGILRPITETMHAATVMSSLK